MINTPTITVGVVAHPQRQEMAEKLADRVDAELICLDRERPPSEHLQGCANTHLAVLAGLDDLVRDADPDDWAVILEDDAVPVADFRFYTKHALAAAPAPIIGLYLGTSAPSETQQQIRRAITAAEIADHAWISADCLIGSVGYAIQAWALPDLIAFAHDADGELPLRISRWAQTRRFGIAYAQPSLVDHDDGESIGRPWRGPGFPKRKAWRFGTRDSWATPTTRLGFCPIWSKA